MGSWTVHSSWEKVCVPPSVELCVVIEVKGNSSEEVESGCIEEEDGDDWCDDEEWEDDVCEEEGGEECMLQWDWELKGTGSRE